MPLTMPEHSWISPPSYGEALNDQPPAYEEIGGVKLWGFENETVLFSRCETLYFFTWEKSGPTLAVQNEKIGTPEDQKGEEDTSPGMFVFVYDLPPQRAFSA